MMPLVASILLVSGTFSARGQERPRYEVNVGYGFAPLWQGNRVVTGTGSHGTLASIYAPYSAKMRIWGTPVAEVSTKVGSRWTASLMFSYSHLGRVSTMQKVEQDGMLSVSSSSSDAGGSALAIIQMWKYEYIQKPAFRLYSSAGVGLGYYSGFKTMSEGSRSLIQEFEMELVPMGFSLGEKWFWFGELGLGTQYIGARSGVGFRF